MPDKEKNEKMVEGEGVINRSLSSRIVTEISKPTATSPNNKKGEEKQ
ncbi:hypothetical protein PT250_02580 [Erysipelothrix rhusiopathiae]|nr:hypothetical protein [Erysipelothrix rhusiopathiae]